MIFAMSDFHAHFNEMEMRVNQIRPMLEDENNKLILQGDFIDRGNFSYQCLQLAYDLEHEYGKEQVKVLKGNHEEWFMDFLFHNGDEWLAEDDNYQTSRTFLSMEQMDVLSSFNSREQRIDYLKECIIKNHRKLITWTNNLAYFYETATQIFVHAGVDEDIPEEEMEFCTIGTSEYIFTGKYPATKGHFYKDVIAGHVSAAKVAHDRSLKGVYFDGASHFYIDGAVARTGYIPCLVYEEEKKQYYQMELDGSYQKIKSVKNA